MARQLRFPAATIQIMMNALGALPDTGGKLRFYEGTQPVTGGGSIGASVLLAECGMATDAFGPCSVSGVITAGFITAEDDVLASGTASWARLVKADNTPVADFSVGTAGCDINLPNNVFIIHGTLAIGALVLTHPLL